MQINLLIIYFSGTGNTEYISRYLESTLKRELDNAGLSRSINIYRVPIERFRIEDIIKHDVIVLGFPIFELNSPEIISNFLINLHDFSIKRMHKKTSKNMLQGMFFFCTMGIAAGNAFRKNFKHLKGSNYMFLGSTAIKMPGSDGLAMLEESSSFVKKALESDYDNIPKLNKFIDRIKTVMEELYVLDSNNVQEKNAIISKYQK
ncbi:MAG: hypothetical protein ACTSRA_11830, partial [Promethearchaeota archaeon]